MFYGNIHFIRYFVKSNYTNIIITTSKFAHPLEGARFTDTKYWQWD